MHNSQGRVVRKPINTNLIEGSISLGWSLVWLQTELDSADSGITITYSARLKRSNWTDKERETFIGSYFSVSRNQGFEKTWFYCIYIKVSSAGSLQASFTKTLALSRLHGVQAVTYLLHKRPKVKKRTVFNMQTSSLVLTNQSQASCRVR